MSMLFKGFTGLISCLIFDSESFVTGVSVGIQSILALLIIDFLCDCSSSVITFSILARQETRFVFASLYYFVTKSDIIYLYCWICSIFLITGANLFFLLSTTNSKRVVCSSNRFLICINCVFFYLISKASFCFSNSCFSACCRPFWAKSTFWLSN